MARGKRARAGSLSGSAGAAPRLPFNPTVTLGEGEVVIHLPELSLIGSGADFDAAKADLVEEIHTYALQFRAAPVLKQATNRTTHEASLQWLEAAEAEGRLEELLFAAPGDSVFPRPEDHAYERLIGDNVGSIQGDDSIRRLHRERQASQGE